MDKPNMDEQKFAQLLSKKDKQIRKLAYEIEELEGAMHRLQKENAGLRILFEQGRDLISRVFDSGEKFSYLGAIKALSARIEKLETFIKQNELEVPKIR